MLHGTKTVIKHKIGLLNLAVRGKTVIMRVLTES
jgi:hypothetical protein